MHSFIPTLIYSSIHSCTHLCTHSFISSLILFIHSFIHSYTYLFICSLIHLLIHSFTHSFIHSWKWQHAPVFLQGESHGQRNLPGCSPRGCRVSGRTERQTLTRSLSPSVPGPRLERLSPAALLWHWSWLVALGLFLLLSAVTVMVRGKGTGGGWLEECGQGKAPPHPAIDTASNSKLPCTSQDSWGLC